MTASKTKIGDVRITKPINSIHIVVFACPNCGEEFEELRLCKECKSPMRVVQVIEKFGTEANEYLAKLKKEGVWDETSVRPGKHDDHDGGVSKDSDELDDIDIKIAGEVASDTDEDDEVETLGDIYPDDDDHKPSTKIEDLDDLAEALEKLDEEEDVSGLEDVPEL